MLARVICIRVIRTLRTIWRVLLPFGNLNRSQRLLQIIRFVDLSVSGTGKDACLFFVPAKHGGIGERFLFRHVIKYGSLLPLMCLLQS